MRAPLQVPPQQVEEADRDEYQQRIAELTAVMRALQISRSEEISIPATLPEPEIQVTTGNDLLMKVANTGGRIRTVSLNAVRGAMSRAWGRSYGAISQVEPNLFMAHFEDFDAMWFVFSEQPWYVGRENLLIELVRPDATPHRGHALGSERVCSS
jgi:hypothetical protein